LQQGSGVPSSRGDERTCLNILLTGFSGFIGRPLRERLVSDGHHLRLAGRRHPADMKPVEDWLHFDMIGPEQAPLDPVDLAGIDVVVNTVGILREAPGRRFQTLHVDGPRRLFDASVRAGVSRIVHVSALGADESAQSRYHLSKKAGDDSLLQLPISSVVVQPSLVYGPGGVSARLFTRLAAAPVLMLPGGGHQQIQPIHIEDLVEALAALATGAGAVTGRVALVGPEALAFRDFLQRLRRSLGLVSAWQIAVPAPLVRIAATVGDHVPASPLDSDTWQMLQRGNVAPVEATHMLLGREPRPVERFVAPEEAESVRHSAQLGVFLPILRGSVAVVWMVTGVLSLGIYPVAESYGLLEQAGVPRTLTPLFLYGAAVLDLAFGVLTLVMQRRARLWLAQIAVIVGYTAIISLRLPEFWLHPYGPILKNLPMLAVLWLLYVIDRGDSRR
jgi:uncharacterized protein YbjT (DUF2867 family)